jgi:predicted MFS family arabinose efflux permease
VPKDEPAVRQRPAPIRLLTQGQFALFFYGNGLSLVGSWMQRIASGWLIWEWTGSAFWVGMLAAGDLLPVMLIGPFAGVAADRWDRLKQNRIAQMVSAVLALLTAVLLMVDQLSLYGLLLLITAQGALVAVVQPARMAMVQQMVARSDMASAVALTSVNVNLARLIGPAIAGAMILRFEIHWVFIVNAAVTAAFVLVLGRIRLTPRTAMPIGANFWSQMTEGFAYVARVAPMRLILIFMLLGGALVRAILELVPALAAQTFSNSALGLAVLTSASAAGAVTAGLTIRAARPRQLFLGVMLWWGLAAGVSMVLAASGDPVVATAAAAVLGYAITHGLVSTQTFVQLTAPDQLRGRALSVHGLIARGSPALGAIVIGYLADRVGLVAGVAGASVVMLCAIAGLLPIARRAAQGLP